LLATKANKQFIFIRLLDFSLRRKKGGISFLNIGESAIIAKVHLKMPSLVVAE
jgi:hypothetical protein